MARLPAGLFPVGKIKSRRNCRDLQNYALTDEEFQVIYQGENDVYCYAKIKNGYATIKGESYDGLKIPSGSYYDLTTLPEKYRPTGDDSLFCGSFGGSAKIFGVVQSDGTVQLYSDAEGWVLGLLFYLSCKIILHLFKNSPPSNTKIFVHCLC